MAKPLFILSWKPPVGMSLFLYWTGKRWEADSYAAKPADVSPSDWKAKVELAYREFRLYAEEAVLKYNRQGSYIPKESWLEPWAVIRHMKHIDVIKSPKVEHVQGRDY